MPCTPPENWPAPLPCEPKRCTNEPSVLKARTSLLLSPTQTRPSSPTVSARGYPNPCDFGAFGAREPHCSIQAGQLPCEPHVSEVSNFCTRCSKVSTT